MATDTPPAADDTPNDLPRPAAGDERREGVLASMLGAATSPVEPARTTPGTPGEVDAAPSDVPVSGASSDTYNDGTQNPGHNDGKSGQNGQVDTNRSVLKTLVLATIDRWAQGGNLAAKRLDIEKVKAQRAPKNDIKEDRKTNRTHTTTTQNSNGAAAGGKGLSAKAKENSDKDRSNNSKDNKVQNASDKSQNAPGGGNSGSGRPGSAGEGGAGSGGAGRGPAKQDTLKPAPKPAAKDTPAKQPKDTGGSKNPPSSGGGAGKGPTGSGGSGGGSGPKGSGTSQGGGSSKPAPSPTKNNGGAGKGDTTGGSGSGGGKNLTPPPGGKTPAQGPSPRPWKDPNRGAGKTNDTAGQNTPKKNPTPAGAGTGGSGATAPGPNGKPKDAPRPQKQDSPKTPTSGAGAGSGGTGATGGKGTTPPLAPIWKDTKGGAQSGRGNALKEHQNRLAKQNGAGQKAPAGADASTAGAGKGGPSTQAGGKTPASGGGQGAGGKTPSSGSTPGAGQGTTQAPNSPGKNNGTGAGWRPPAGNTPVLSKTGTNPKTPSPNGGQAGGSGANGAGSSNKPQTSGPAGTTKPDAGPKTQPGKGPLPKPVIVPPAKPSKDASAKNSGNGGTKPAPAPGSRSAGAGTSPKLGAGTDLTKNTRQPQGGGSQPGTGGKTSPRSGSSGAAPGKDAAAPWRPRGDHTPVLSKDRAAGGDTTKNRGPAQAPASKSGPKPAAGMEGPSSGGSGTTKPVTAPPTTPTTPAPKSAAGASPKSVDNGGGKPTTGPAPKPAPGPKTTTAPAAKDTPKTSGPAPTDTEWKNPPTKPTPGPSKAPQNTEPATDQPNRAKAVLDKLKKLPGSAGTPPTTTDDKNAKTRPPAAPGPLNKTDKENLPGTKWTTGKQHGTGDTADPKSQKKPSDQDGGTGKPRNAPYPPKPTHKPSVGPQQTGIGTKNPAQPEQKKPIRTQPSREAGYRDGARVAGVAGHVRAYGHGFRDGLTDGTTAAKHDQIRMDQARKDRQVAHQKEKPVSTPAATPRYTRPDPKPIKVQKVGRTSIELGDGAREGKETVSRGEVATLKDYERRLHGKSDAMDQSAEVATSLEAHAIAQAEKATRLLEAAKTIKAGDNLIGDLTTFHEAAQLQAGKAQELRRRSLRSGEASRVLLNNVDVRYGGIYNAIVNSPDTSDNELIFYKEDLYA